MKNINKILSEEFKIQEKYINAVTDMIDEGNTVPFIARYRKEATGGLSDVQLRDVYERLNYLRNLEERKVSVKKSIEEQGKLSEELSLAIDNANTLTEVEDLYRPYKQKKRTRAIMAEEKGLKPLAEAIYGGEFKGDINEFVKTFIDEEKGVNSERDAIQGAEDIIAEFISDEASFRKYIRDFVMKTGYIVTKGESEEPTPFEMYYDYKEEVKKIPPHRIMAINRGEKEKVLTVKIQCDEDRIIDYLKNKSLKNNDITDFYIEEAIKDSLKRLIYPSIEREIRSTLSEKGEDNAIEVFKKNLKALLMQSPIKGKTVLGFDPGFRTGCKIAVLDETGKILDTETVYVTAASKDQILKSKDVLKQLVLKNNVDVISLGNGTASRESEEIIAEILKEVKEEQNKEIYYVIVSEAGASVYSASELATKEYPDINVSIRGAISIGRRLQDPMAELVKIDPKSIGVGQYQHDVTPKKLEESLKGVVEDSVNNVGVDLNVATPSLLAYIAGINGTLAENIVAYREENGKFKSRKELLKVKRLGPKAYEQCAGFLRVVESKEPLDNTGVHPESYDKAKKLIKILGYSLKDLENKNLEELDKKIAEETVEALSEKIEIGVPTLLDIVKEIKKPGRDIREELPKPILKSGIIEMSDLNVGMELQGTVRNVADFGAFVDIGVHVDGLVHKSQMANVFVKHPLDIVSVGDVINVKILEVDEKRKRISLTMK
ncbi:MAG: Tex family protein [Clostridiaceae bacterium]